MKAKDITHKQPITEQDSEYYRLEGRIKSLETQLENGDIVSGDMLTLQYLIYYAFQHVS